MAIKDRLVSWFLRNIVIPKIDVWNKPGFVVTQFTDKGKFVFLREIFLPESILIDLEKEIAKKYDKKGEQILYSIGKKFGYTFSYLSNFSTIKNLSEKTFLDFAYKTVRYVECTYSSHLDHSIDLKSKTFLLRAKNYVVCPKNGLGYILGSGGIAGIWGYVMNDKDIEGLQIKCQGKGDKFCEIVCAPKDVLIKYNKKFFIENNLIENIKSDYMYKKFNRFQNTKFASKSLKDMIYNKLFTLSGGILKFCEIRHVYVDSSLIYILEKEIRKLKNAGKILTDIAFECGKKIAEDAKVDSTNFITEYFSAIGFGDTLVTKKDDKYNVIINYFPWTALWKDINFDLCKGLVSGLLSRITGYTYYITEIKKEIVNDSFTLVLNAEKGK
jgi:predicted hydrocarbon binding protein